MSNIEHLIENAIYSVEKNESYEEWKSKWQQRIMLKEAKSDPFEIWQIAQYCVYVYKESIEWKLSDEIESKYGYPIPE